jgi:hypothetical protein
VSPKIIVSPHAQSQARERYGDRSIDYAQITREVGAALRSSRVACRPPHAFRIREKSKTKSGRAVRYCWTIDGRRCYVISERRSDGRNGSSAGERLMIVVTALTPAAERAAA